MKTICRILIILVFCLVLISCDEKTTETQQAKVTTPTFSPFPGVYYETQTVSITCATVGAKIYYTTDGTEPSAQSTLYSEPLEITGVTTLKAIAYKAKSQPSAAAVANYVILPFDGVANPTFSPGSGTYTIGQTVTLACETIGAKIYYTIDGSDPTRASTLYVNPIVLTASTNLKAKAYLDDLGSSSIVAANYTINNLQTVDIPVFSPSGGTYTTSQMVSISCSTTGAQIRYTMDGNEPNLSSAIYTNPINVSTSVTIKAKAYSTGWNPSITETEVYVINQTPIVAAPQFSLQTGVYNVAQLVSINCPTSDAIIYYTIDGSEPTIQSSMYVNPIQINTTTTLKARAYKDDMTASPITAATYTLVIIRVATPQFTPQAGVYNVAQTVNISCSTADAEIHYTTDGSEPSIYSNMYANPILVSNTTTLKAKAFKAGLTESITATATYTLTVLSPQFTPLSGVYNDAQSININCLTDGAQIYYTTDGSTPTAESNQYLNPISVSTTTTIKAIAVKSGWTASTIATATYTLTALAPEFSLQSGVYNVAQLVNITCPTSDAEIRYTTDGSSPTVNSSLYSSPIAINTTTTLKAVAFKQGWTASPITTATYTITILTVGAPQFSLQTGVYYANQLVTITCSTSGAEIHYTTDGSEPTLNSTLYTSSIPINTSSTLKAVAFKEGWTTSAITTATYTLAVLTPQYIPLPGTFNTEQSVTITCATAGAEIHYTTDGSEPTVNSALYSYPISIGATTTFKTAAFKSGWTQSSIATATYALAALAPQFSLQSGTYNVEQSVSISCPTADVDIRYTTDGTIPTIESSLYVNPILISATTTLKAVAFKAGWTASSTTSATYTISVINVSTPIFSVPTGMYYANQTVNITCSTSGAAIHYTTDGTEPTIYSTQYSNPISISTTATLQARAFRTGWTPSTITTATYTLAVLAPQFNPAPGTYNVAQAVTITCATSGAEIHYTTDGSEPTINSALYTSAIPVSATTTLKAGAFKSGWTTGFAAATYTISVENVATPVFSVQTGVYYATQTVNITCSTSGTEIHYTTDGSEPTINSTLYTNLITISSSVTLKARAFKTGWIPSSIISATYTLTVLTPQFSPQQGVYNSAQSVGITCATSGAEIRYTTDGSEPTTESALYAGPITVSVITTLKAAAFKSGWTTSYATATYTLAVLAPQFSVQTGIYNAIQTVAITCPTSGTEIRYTTDGSEPSISSTLYVNPISINQTTTLKAAAFKTGWTPSNANATYTLAVLSPQFSPIAGVYNVAQSVTITCPTNGAEIRYTTDGSEPTLSSNIYTNPININTSTTVKAAAFKTGWTTSPTVTSAYSIVIQTVTTPQFNPQAGTYNTAQFVSITCSTNGAEIHYTTDGTEPNINSTLYTGSISVSTTTTIKAAAFKTGWTPSATTSATYSFAVLAPQITPQTGIFNSTQTINITCPTSGAEIRYTTNGTEPTINSTLYSIPFTVNSTTTVKAAAFKAGWTTSATVTATYTLVLLPPQFTPQAGIYYSAQSVSINSPNSNAEIRYTTDGSNPSISSTPYTNPISVLTSTTIKAAAFLTGWTTSSISSATYTLTVEAPLFSIQSGAFNVVKTVSITCPTSGAEIRYTTDGSAPSQSSTLYTNPILIGSTQTVKAIAFKSGWAMSSLVSASYTINLPPTEMVYVPGGTFNMGSLQYPDQGPIHEVTVSAFSIGKYEVSQAEWNAVMSSNPSWFNGDTNKPVEQASWYAALVYCNLRSIAESKEPVYTINGSTIPTSWGSIPTTYNAMWNNAICDWSANGYRLPTEAEWEYAARGATNHPEASDSLYSGSNSIDNVGWYLFNSDYTTHSKGLKQANTLGLFDMSGNVYEWCWDWYSSEFPWVPGDLPLLNYRGPDNGIDRVSRGGSWHHETAFSQARYRSSFDPPASSYDIGLRVCRSLPNPNRR